MKTRNVLCALMMAAAFPFHAGAGTLFYVPIPATGSDAQSGMDPAKVYTSAIAAGNTKAAGRTVNGVALGTLSGSGKTVTANGVTLSAATGTLINGGGKAGSIQADGAMADLFSGMIFNDGAGDNSEQYVVLDPATLTAGKTYDLRVYVCNASGENRQVSLSFAGDGKAAVSTDFFNEDDATTSAGGFIEPNQVYYINYRFTWDGVSTPGFTATQKFGSTPFCLYALTNQETGGDADARPAGAVVAVDLRPALTSRSTRTTYVETDEEIGVSSEVFYTSNSLRNHGRWVTVGTYGRCWQPTGVDRDWQPYTRGRWVYSSDNGWVWVSDEDFGWATYHYGRWFREEDSGWYWVPGRVWAPAWVSWRHGHSYVGWAPLPPPAIAAAGMGIGSWADHRWGIGPRAYNFVNVRDFGAPSMAGVLIPPQQNPAIMTSTTNVTNIVNNRRGIYNGGPNFQAVNNALVRTGSQPIPAVEIHRNAGTKPVTPDGKFSQLTAGVLAMTAPTVTRNKKPGSLPPVAATIAAPKFDKGWTGLPDPKNAAALQAKIANETPGQTAKSAPARLPGTPPPTPDGVGPRSAGPLKPFRPGMPGDTTPIKPGQPATPPGAIVAKPGQPVNPTTGATFTKPGKPANPTIVTPPQPGQPVTPVPDFVNKRGKTPKTVTEPVPQAGQPVKPADAPVIKPTQPVPAPVIKPTIPKAPPSEPDRPRKRTPQPEAPVKPAVPSVTPPEPTRPMRRTPEIATPIPAPVRAATPVPAVPRPTPVERVNPRPAPPVTVPVRPAAPPPAPVARPTPLPAPPVAAPARPAPPVAVPVKPAPPAPPAPPPTPPKKGEKPTPTPVPGTNG